MKPPSNITALYEALITAGGIQKAHLGIQGSTIFITNDIKGQPERKTLLRTIASRTGGVYKENSTTGLGGKSSVGRILYGTTMAVIHKKGSSGSGSGGSLAKLDARIFSARGINGTFQYHGKPVPVKTFTKASTMAESIIEGCRKSPQLGEAWAECFTDFFKDPRTGIGWGMLAHDAKRKLGVYVGELLIGWAFLSGHLNMVGLAGKFGGTPKAVHLPTDPAFKGVDSFLEFGSKHEYWAVSSKYGEGAKASVIGNLMEPGLAKKAKGELQRGKPFHSLMSAAEGHTDKETGTIIYKYGTRHILKLTPQEFSDTQVVKALEEAKKTDAKSHPDAGVLATQINALWGKNTLPGVNPEIRPLISNNKVQGITPFFNQTCAAQINATPADIKALKEILAGKDYWQVNLDERKWEKGGPGCVFFTTLHSKQAVITIIGNKTPIKDPTAKQGWINYLLTEK